MPLRLNVRLAREGDVDQLTDLIVRLKSLNSELDPHFLPDENILDTVRRYVGESITSDKAVVLVAEDEESGRIVGVLRFEIVDRLFYKPRIKAVITDIYVHPAYRGKGIGRLLVERAAAEAKKRGAGLLTVIYPEGNLIAESFYNKMGFQPLQKEKYLRLQ
ncbi:MAG: GNAT family N-acetyltransferase [Desulfurococcales archaeon]|nr:GNAT family N-acetyltransferase [Desulfurococcales archaeon]